MSPSSTPTASEPPTATRSSSPTPTATPSATAIPSLVPTATRIATATASRTASAPASRTASATHTPSAGVSFATTQLTIAGLNVSGALVAADLNGDGIGDLVSAGRDQPDLATLIGAADGSFQLTESTRRGFGDGDITVADIDGDGRLDIIATNGASGSISTALGGEDGTLAPVVNSPAGTRPDRIEIRDIDRDRKPDAIIATDGGVLVLRGKGDGSFQLRTTIAAGLRVADLGLIDADHDGAWDILATLPTANEVILYRGDGRGAFSATAPIVVAQPSALSVGDWGGDGRLDFVVANSATRRLMLFTTLEVGFDSGCTVASEIGATRLLRTDLDGDGRPDLIAHEDASGAVRVLLGQPGAICGTAFGAAIDPGAGPTNAIAVTDLNRDRRPDLILGSATVGALGIATNAIELQLVPGDVNRDGRLDRVDIDLLVAELFDGDGDDATSTAGGSLATGAEADVDGDHVVGAGDLSALVLRRAR